MCMTQALGALSEQLEWGFIELVLADVISPGLTLIEDNERFRLVDCVSAKTQP